MNNKLSQNVQSIAIYNCHKSCYSFGLKELWSCLTNGEPEIGCLLYSSFDGGKQSIPSYLAAYGYALALSGKTEEAINALLSFDKDYRPFSCLDISWQQAIQSDVSELIEREENRAKLLPVLTALHTAGWEINIPTSNNAVS